MTRLHITNGDSTGDRLEVSLLTGDVLVWRDILHDGPVPGSASIEELAELRTDFLLDAFSIMKRERIAESFVERATVMQRLDDFEEITLWFEHDLYDQLQILEVLHQISISKPTKARLTMVCVDRFDGIDRFLSLGQLNPVQIATLDPGRHEISDAEFDTAARAWKAFTSDNPEDLNALIDSDTSALPFLDAALRRQVEQYPSATNGLSRTERTALELVDGGISKPGMLFAEHQHTEESPYLGDWSFWKIIEGLVNVETPAMTCTPGPDFVHPPGGADNETFITQRLALTEYGRQLLSGDADWVDTNGIDRWSGGVQLTGAPDWRDDGNGKLVPR